jgi:hypothetical protein
MVRNVFEQLRDGVRYIPEGAKRYTFVISKLAVVHITMILDDFSNVFRRQILV